MVVISYTKYSQQKLTKEELFFIQKAIANLPNIFGCFIELCEVECFRRKVKLLRFY